ncbi:hypothetical protein ACMXYQ_16410 [Neptuniibacter sp. PT34_22]|uniref:hypothetical protein n=1 Tax=Neptuniibacter sp. PT34_22 TaxID=3398205 RepID=UPI0039F4C0A1
MTGKKTIKPSPSTSLDKSIEPSKPYSATTTEETETTSKISSPGHSVSEVKGYEKAKSFTREDDAKSSPKEHSFSGKEIYADESDDRITTRGKDDYIDAGDGDNFVRSGNGDDSITTGNGKDKIFSGKGDDLIKAGDGNNLIKSGSGHDTIISGEGKDKVLASHGDDIIDAGNGNNFVHAGSGDNIVLTGDGKDRIISLHGDDVIDAGDGNNFIKTGHGNDTISSGLGNDKIIAGQGDDIIDAGSGSDKVNAGKGNDSLFFNISDNSGENNYYNGSQGVDTLTLQMTHSEYETYQEELAELSKWAANNAISKSEGKGSHDGNHQPVFETSFGLKLRSIEEINIEFTDSEYPEVELPPVESEIEATITGEGPIPLKNVDVSLVEGSQITFDVEVSVEELPAKYDVFMLHDLSGSFWNDLPNVQAQFSGLYDSLTADADVAFGVGSFVDKPMETFGSSYDYVYNTDLSVTSDKETIQTTLDNLRTSSGWDWPESQMEALVQTALREDEIGFRDSAQKFAVLFTDAPYHKEGDYETTSVYDSETGTMTSVAVADNDYDTEFEVEDYPDPAVVGRMLIDAGVTPVFAVTAPYIDMYQQLVDEWGVGIVTELTSDSSNIADAITNGITEAPLNLELEALGDDYGFVSSVEPPIYENAEPGSYNFTVTMEIPEESESYSSDSITLEVTGYGEVNVNVEIDKVDITGDSTNDTLTGDAGPNAIYGMEGDDTLIGTGGSDQLFGGSGYDTLTGGLADDELTGGSGDDVFVFSSGDGSDTVTDFSEGDLLDLRRVSSIENFADVEAAATQVEADTVLDFGNGDSITLLGVNAETLSEDSLII